MIIIKLFISLILPFLAGYAFLNFLFRRDKLNFLASFGFSYGLGMGILTQWMLFLHIIGISYSVGAVAIPLLFFSVLFFFLAFKQEKKSSFLPSEPPSSNSYKALYIILGIYIIYCVFYAFWRALNIPIHTWDAIASIAFKAKVFFFEKSLFHLKDTPPHPSYPLHVSLSQTWITLNLGAWSDQYIKIIFPFALLSFIAVYNYFLTIYTNKKWAILGVVMLISSNLLIRHATISYRDFFLLYYASGTIMLLLLWLNKKDDAFLILASFYAGFATFTKLEGIPYLFICTALFLLVLFRQKITSFKENAFKFLKFTVPAFSICAFFNLYKALENFPVRASSRMGFSQEHLSRIPIILKKFAEDLFLSANWNIIWFLLAVSLIINAVKIKRKFEIRFLCVALMMFFGLYFSLALFTTEFKWISGSHSITTLSRLILHSFPLAPLLIILLNYPKNPLEKSREDENRV